MAIKFKHGDEYTMYFCTFTCYKWMNLFERANAYDTVYKCPPVPVRTGFDELKKINQQPLVPIAIGIIMPNHLHVILYFPDPGYSLNKIISNAKRFIAYEIINRLEEKNMNEELDFLHGAVTKREEKKGQIHKVFEESLMRKAFTMKSFLFKN